MDSQDSRTTGLIEAPALPTYDLGSEHPFARDRQLGLFDLLRRMDLYQPAQLCQPAAASRSSLTRVHDPAYLDMVEAISVPSPQPADHAAARAFGLGTPDNPISPGQHEAAAAVCGATEYCVQQVLDGTFRHAFNPAGGLHHAHRAAASGFCVYNDLAVGIHAALEAGLERVLYVDFDVHHGDGVEGLFASDPRVMTVSLHQSPDSLFPGTGRVSDLGHGSGQGSVINLPLAPYTADDSWTSCIEQLLPPLVQDFQPELILSQHGCDPHALDPLAQLELTTAPMHRAAQLCKDLADAHCQGRWVATGGGGYQPLRVIPRAWALVWLAMNDRAVPEQIDPAWLEAWQARAPGPLEPGFFDPRPPLTPTHREAARINDLTLQRFWELYRAL